MTLRFSIVITPQTVALWAAGGGLCCCCFADLAAPDTQGLPLARTATIEHVLPKSPRACDLPKIAAFRAIVGRAGRKAMAHWKCNHRKGNRPPTGCEVIFLMAVNARLGLGDPPPRPGSQKRTRSRKARRIRARTIRAMQAAMS